jgi:hypothetical protein
MVVEGDGPRKNRCAIRGKSLATQSVQEERAVMREPSERARRLDISMKRLRVTALSQACYRVTSTFVTGPSPWRVSVMRSLVGIHKFS